MWKSLIGAALALLPVAATASETITYTYDAKGRLTAVAHAGSVNNALAATYTFDRADNRTNLTVAGATPRLVVVPLNGLTPIVIAPAEQ